MNNVTNGKYIEIEISSLLMDRRNPRIPKSHRDSDEIDLIHYMWKAYSLEDLIISINKNGFIKAEPLMLIPDENSKNNYIVVEGNRRLAALRVLTDEDVRNALPSHIYKEYPIIKEEDIGKIPCILYNRREDVESALAVRHITGIRKWETREKAEFISNFYDNNPSIVDIRKTIGSRSDSIGATLFAYRWVQYFNEKEGILSDFFENRLSLLILAFGQLAIRNFIGFKIPWTDVNYNIDSYDKEIKNRVRMLCEWLEDTKLIKDSRQITGKDNTSLSRILACDASREYFIQTTLNDNVDYDGASLRVDVDQTLHIKFNQLRDTSFNLINIYKQCKQKGIEVSDQDIAASVKATIEVLIGYNNK